MKVDIDLLVEKGLVNYSDGDMVIMDSPEAMRTIDSTVKLEMVVIIYCLEGHMQCDINGKTCRVEPGDMLILPPNTCLDHHLTSADYRSRILGLSYKAIQNSMLMSKDMWDIMVYIAQNPVVHLNDKSKELIDRLYSVVAFKIDNPHGFYHKEIMQSLFNCLFYEMAAIVAPQAGTHHKDPTMKQGELLFRRFIRAISEGTVSTRSVKDYAEHLCVTPKYLSTVCKNVSGKTALEWIHDFLAESITHKLKYSDTSIKEIAESLGFPNLSFFGKFVKSRFNLSPTEYRRMLKAQPRETT